MKQIQKTIWFLVLIFAWFLITENLFAGSVFAATDSTLTISTTSLSAVTVDSDVFASTSQTITVSTNNYTGYNLTLTTSGASTNLAHTNSNIAGIPTITLPNGRTSILSSEFGVGYGFSVDNTNYMPVPTPGGSGFQMANVSAAGTNTHTLTFGVKVDDSVASGTYQNTFVITAVAKAPQYSVTYDSNTNDTVTGMPANITTTVSSNATITLANDVPVRANYNFLGWDTNSAATTPTYPTGQTNTIELEPTTSNAITVYAIWQSAGGGHAGTPDDPYQEPGNYDPTSLPEGTTVYTNVPGQPQVTVDEDGNITEFEFTNAESGINISDAAIDTGYIPFRDDNDFELRIKASFPAQGNNSNPTGVLLDIRNREGNSGDYLQLTYAKNKTVPIVRFRTKDYNLQLSNFTYNGVTYSNYVDLKITVQNGTWTVTYYTYTVSGGNLVATPHNVNVNGISSLNIPAKTVLLGYTLNTSGQVTRQAASTTVYEFSLKDI